MPYESVISKLSNGIEVMGYIRNEAMIVSGSEVKRVLRAHSAAVSIFNAKGMGGLVSGIQQHMTNGGGAFFISPDGSKEGWETSNIAAEAREELITFLRDHEDLWLDWALIVLGGDDGEFSVSRSRADENESK